MKKNIALLSALTMITALVGCESENNTSSPEIVETIAETTSKETSTKETTTTVLATTTTTTTTSEISNAEENASIISTLTNMFTFDTQDDPIITFDSKINMYIVVAPSQIKCSEFDKTHSNNEWKSFSDRIASLSKSAADFIHILDESANVKVIFSSQSMPLIICNNEKVVFDFYDSEKSEKACSYLETVIYTHSVGCATASYDKSSNAYILTLRQNFTKESTTDDELNSLLDTLTEFCEELKKQCLIIDDTTDTLTIEYIDSSDDSAMLTIVDGEVIYNYSEDE